MALRATTKGWDVAGAEDPSDLALLFSFTLEREKGVGEREKAFSRGGEEKEQRRGKVKNGLGRAVSL